MIEGLIKQFLGSGTAGEAVAALKGKGLSEDQAKGAVDATAKGAVEALGGGGGGEGGGMLGGLGGALGGLLGGGGGGAGGLGALLGGGGVPPAILDQVVGFVTQKTGLSEEHARMAANVVLPKIIDFVKSKMG